MANPVPFVIPAGPVFTSSSDIGGGRHYTRFRGPIYIGYSRKEDSPGGGGTMSAATPEIINVSTVTCNLVLVATTFASTTGVYISTGAVTDQVLYTGMTSAGSLVTGGSTATAPNPLMGGQHGAGIIFEKKSQSLNVYDPLSSAHVLIGGVGTGATLSTSAPANALYCPMTTGGGNLIAAGSTANVPPILTTALAGLAWDDAQKTLAVFSPGSSAWLWPHVSTAGGASLVWSASSS